MSNKIFKNVGIILGCSIIAKILSYIWEAVLAAYIGVTDQADAFYMVTSVFGVLYPILDLGIWKVFLPAYKSRLVKKQETKAEELANISITFFFLLSVALVALLIFLTKPLVMIVAPGFDAEKKAMTVQFLRLSSAMYFLMTTASIIGAMLQSREKFLGSQVREIGTHVSKIIFGLITFRYFGIYAAVAAMVVGSIFRVLIQLPFIDWKWRFKPNFHLGNTDVKSMMKGLPAVAITAAIANLNGMIDKIVASGTVTGSVASLNYGDKLMNVFSGMISVAIATAVYPTTIQYIAEKEECKLKELLRNAISALMFCIIPISLFCFVFSEELVTVAFQRGAFDAMATKTTAGVFAGYCVGMLFIGVSGIITNVFYGYGDTKKTMYFSIAEIILNVVFDITFVRWLGVSGLAYATSISALLCLGMKFMYLRKYVKIGNRKISIEGIKILLISVASCILPYVLTNYAIHMNVYLILLIDALLFGGLFLGLSFLLRVNALRFVGMMLSGKNVKETK